MYFFQESRQFLCPTDNLDDEHTTPWTSSIVVVVSMCFLAEIVQAGNFSREALKFLYMILNIALHCCNLYKFIGFNFSKQLNIDRPSFLVDSMVTMRIVFEDHL
jgi:hypothetical protein